MRQLRQAIEHSVGRCPKPPQRAQRGTAHAAATLWPRNPQRGQAGTTVLTCLKPTRFWDSHAVGRMPPKEETDTLLGCGHSGSPSVSAAVAALLLSVLAAKLPPLLAPPPLAAPLLPSQLLAAAMSRPPLPQAAADNLRSTRTSRTRLARAWPRVVGRGR
jgi:hypothetical protein